MKFNLTPRERKMLMGLLALILGAGFFRFVYLPIQLDRESTRMIHERVISEETVLMNSVLSTSALKDKIHDLQRTSKLLTKQLPPAVEQEYIVSDLLSITSANGTELLDISFEEDKKDNVSGTVESVDDALAIYEASMEQKTDKINELKNMFSGQATSDTTEESEDELPIERLTMNFTCRGQYEHLRGVIKDLNELDNMVIVKEIMFVKESDSMTNILATFTLEYPYYEDNSDYELAPWNSLELKGEGIDPFNYFVRGSQLDPNIPKINSTAITSIYTDVMKPTKDVSIVDFYISARPTSSDDFAYTISKNGDSSYRLSSDLDGETMELRIMGSEGGLAFMMGTKLRPITETTKATAFAPEASSAVNVKILSQPRVGDNDTTKAVLKVVNTSSKQVIITVQDEDGTNPRVSIMKEGNVTVK